jgi:hypothetical protein
MKALTTLVRCDSPQCLATGNAERIFTVGYHGGAPQTHTIRCPYCHGKLQIELGGAEVWYIEPDRLLAS